MSFEPEEIKASIQKIIPDFEMDYDVDPVRQSIAESLAKLTRCFVRKRNGTFHQNTI